jgi:hypothetical protein
MEKSMESVFRTPRSMRGRRYGYTTAVFFGMIFAHGCQTAPLDNIPKDPVAREQRAMARATERWQHIREKSLEKAYAMFTETSKKGFTIKDLEAQLVRTQMRGGTAKSAVCDADSCAVTVDVELSFRVPRVGNVQQVIPFQEQWLIEKGDFYLIRK